MAFADVSELQDLEALTQNSKKTALNAGPCCRKLASTGPNATCTDPEQLQNETITTAGALVASLRQ